MSVTLVTGGCRSGKSEFALSLTEGRRRLFVATAQALDDEMTCRIARHRRERGDDFPTVEVPLQLPACLSSLENDTVALVDCLTIWTSNVMFHCGEAENENYPLFDSLIDVVKDPCCDLIFVSGEVGLGLVPADAESRKYRDLLGRLNQRIAALADQVWFCVAGIPLRIK